MEHIRWLSHRSVILAGTSRSLGSPGMLGCPGLPFFSYTLRHILSIQKDGVLKETMKKGP